MGRRQLAGEPSISSFRSGRIASRTNARPGPCRSPDTVSSKPPRNTVKPLCADPSRRRAALGLSHESIPRSLRHVAAKLPARQPSCAPVCTQTHADATQARAGGHNTHNVVHTSQPTAPATTPTLTREILHRHIATSEALGAARAYTTHTRNWKGDEASISIDL
ncbi:hypothetical protein C8Q79DRAFT_790001 [Trametes meyenii]|nr:hypothetical protein C8Q79DRAFT_790001 [Trametes meyenii]